MKTTNSTGYTRLSIAAHWLGAIAVAALFITHEGERGSAMMQFHIGGGAIIGLFLLWRVWRRLRAGTAPKPQQHPALNLLATTVLYGLLACIVVVCVTGYLLPWSGGRPLDIYGLSIPSPFAGSRDFHEAMEQIHDIAGHLFIPLIGLHILGVLKHLLLDNDGNVAGRMFLPDNSGR